MKRKLVLAMGLVFFTTHAEARFLENINKLRLQTTVFGNGKLAGFLDGMDQACQMLGAEQDRTYYRTIGSEAFPSEFSPFSVQSRLCATVILQHDPRQNLIGIKMGACTKFKEPTLSCCLLFEAAFQDPDLKGTAEQLCAGVPNYLELVIRRRTNTELRVSSEPRSDTSSWSCTIL